MSNQQRNISVHQALYTAMTTRVNVWQSLYRVEWLSSSGYQRSMSQVTIGPKVFARSIRRDSEEEEFVPEEGEEDDEEGGKKTVNLF